MFRKKRIMDFSEIPTDVVRKEYMKEASYQGCRGDGIAALKLAYIYSMGRGFQSSDFWFSIAIQNREYVAYKERAELHFIYSDIKVEETFISKVKPDLNKALFYIQKAIEHNVPGSLSIRARILLKLQKDVITDDFIDICKEAALSDKDDWCCSFLMSACFNKFYQAKVKQYQSLLSAMFEWLTISDNGPLSGMVIVKMALNNIIQYDYLPLLINASEKDIPEALFLYGKYLITSGSNIFKGESLIRKAIRRGYTAAIPFLADWKLYNPQYGTFPEVLSLYHEAEQNGHRESGIMLAIIGLNKPNVGMRRKDCINKIIEGCNDNIPLALKFAEDHNLIVKG